MNLKYVLDYGKHVKEMERENRGSQARVGFIKGLIDQKTADIISVTQKGEVSTWERIKIKREVKADLQRSIGRVGLTMAALIMAGGIATKARNVLTEGTDNNKVAVEASNFDESLKVDLEKVVEQDEILRENVENEIDSLSNSKEVLQSVKKMYVEKYNSENGTNYKAKDIKFWKQRGELVESKAENGDNIVRLSKDKRIYQHTPTYIEVSVEKGESATLLERGTIVLQDKYQNVYDYDENVAMDKEANELGEVICTGIDYSIALNHKEENSMETMEKYKERFKVAMIEYRESKIDKVIHEKKTEAVAQLEDSEKERD